jgi:putative transcriptional regulator
VFDQTPDIIFNILILRGMVKRNDKLILESIGKRIAELRQAKQWTVRDLADEIESDHAWIVRIETGKVNPSILTLYRIAAALQTDVSTLLPSGK